MEEGYGGFADLGSILAGGNEQANTAAFNRGATQRASLDSALAQARINRDKAMAREQNKQALAKAGIPENLVDLFDVNARAGFGSDFAGTMRGTGDMQTQNFRNQAVEAGKGGDLSLMNVLLAGAQGNPMTTAQVDEGYQINPHGDPAQKPVVTEGELADIMANTSLAKSREANTSLANAREEQTRDKTANPDKYKPLPKSGKTSDNGDVPEPAKRKVGKVYDTPKGKLKWTGTGWVKP